jgi:hypothetical protein
MLDRVFHQRLQAQEGHGHRQHLWRDLQGHGQSLAEPGAFEHQVLVD